VNIIRVVNRSRGTLLGNRILLVDSWPGRLRGYLGRPKPLVGEGMLLVRCNAVHMYGLSFPLDLIFLDKEGDVVDVVEALQPWKRTKRIPRARFALELPTGAIAASHTRVGDGLMWTSPEPVFTPSPRLGDLSRVGTGPWIDPPGSRH
jgi:uncharacterized membrane protein (UPF0127 family)